MQRLRIFFGINTTFMGQLREAAEDCGYIDFAAKLPYPPNGPIDLGKYGRDIPDKCNIYGFVEDHGITNPGFTMNHVAGTWPRPQAWVSISIVSCCSLWTERASS